MKVIEALKKVKYNRKKAEDLVQKIRRNAAHLESEGSAYKDARASIEGWVQSIRDTNKETTLLMARIQRTNLATMVPVTIDGKEVYKSVAEWIVRRRETLDVDRMMFEAMTKNGLTNKTYKEDGELKIDPVVLNFDSEARDKQLAILQEEPYLIDSALEISNAVTDLLD